MRTRIIDPSDLAQLNEMPEARLGAHLLVDFLECSSLPSESALLEEWMLGAAEKLGATVVTSTFHAFSPHGLSGVVVIAESHLAAHTWPEHRAACLDFFTCNESMDPAAGLRYLFEQFGAGSMQLLEASRACNLRPRLDS